MKRLVGPPWPASAIGVKYNVVAVFVPLAQWNRAGGGLDVARRGAQRHNPSIMAILQVLHEPGRQAPIRPHDESVDVDGWRRIDAGNVFKAEDAILRRRG